MILIIAAIIITLIVYLSKTIPIRKGHTLKAMKAKYLSETYHSGGKTIFTLTSTQMGITENAIIQVYFKNGVISPSLGTLSFTGKLFSVFVSQITGNNKEYLIKLSSNINEDIIIFVDGITLSS